MTDPIRLDKWLWAARFFKTRSQAQEAIDSGKVQVDGARAKPSRSVAAGQRIAIRKGEERWEVEVLAVSGRRGPAPEARQLYQETAASLADRERAAAERKAMPRPRKEKWVRDKKKMREIQKLLRRR
jgi:ribosome-associated heat shock protein Hsp15